MSRILLLCLLLGCSRGVSTERQPWLGEPYELVWRTAAIYQGYASLASGSSLKHYPSHDGFLQVSLSGFLPEFALEMEAVGACTRRQKGDFDHFSITGRYVWQDDIAGDPLSVTTGVSLSYACPLAVKDVSAFHHGWGEVEAFLSVGQERAQGALWHSRWWGLLGLGLAEQGSPWLRAHLSYEKRLGEQHEVGVFAEALSGLGRHRLHVVHFQGYGAIQHHSIDIGIRYAWEVACFGKIGAEYAYRVYAKNFPAHAQVFLLRILYPFGL